MPQWWYKSKSIQIVCVVGICLPLALLSGCAGHSKKIAMGMLGGAAVGAAVGYQFVHHGENKQYETQNTIMTSVVFALATGGVLAWHYRELEEQKVEISGRYARYRLCDPKEMNIPKELSFDKGESCAIYPIEENKIGSKAISLDDNTKWAYPVFRKRYLQPDRGDGQVISKRYIWEIIKPGSFVTRSQDPQYFIELEDDEP